MHVETAEFVEAFWLRDSCRV